MVILEMLGGIAIASAIIVGGYHGIRVFIRGLNTATQGDKK